MNTDTKQVRYKGTTYEVPTWVNYIAEEENGDLWGYADEPQICEEDGEWYGGLCRLISKRPTNWTNSKEKV
jgi:hypothetical protein